MITTQELIRFYGNPSAKPKYLTTIDLPYPMRLAWDIETSVNRMSCHKLVAERFKSIFKDVLAAYGYNRIQELNIDLYGGCFNYRKMRGGSEWSRHSWGVAIDLHPVHNRLKWGSDKAAFAKPEYEFLHDIFNWYGFENLGKVKNYDWMHWQIKSGVSK